jgi:hypothetical protein
MIRPPDEYRMETLVPHNQANQLNNKSNLSYDEQMKIALEISKQDFSDEMEELEEQQVILFYQEQLKERETQMSGILLKYKKVAKYDKSFNELLPMLEYACDSYVNGYTDSCYFEKEVGDKLMKHFQQIRLSEKERNIVVKVFKI